MVTPNPAETARQFLISNGEIERLLATVREALTLTDSAFGMWNTSDNLGMKREAASVSGRARERLVRAIYHLEALSPDIRERSGHFEVVHFDELTADESAAAWKDLLHCTCRAADLAKNGDKIDWHTASRILQDDVLPTAAALADHYERRARQ